MTHPFDQDYFHGGHKVGGYAGEGYRDFPVHAYTAQRIIDERPVSVLELGCARGYVLKRVEDAGIPVLGLEVSEHCHLTRAVQNVVTWDITRTPWPVADDAFDLCVSVAVLEHVPEAALPGVFSEMARTCRRGLHGVDVHDEDGFDKTHVTIRPVGWWQARLPPGQVAVDKEVLEAPVVVPPPAGGLKLNLGSYTTMFAGWRNIDQIDLTAWAARQGYSFACHDVRHGLPFDDGVVDLIYASHLLEHLTYAEGHTLLTECRRVLKPGGLLRVAVPDAANLVGAYQAGTIGHFDEISAAGARSPFAAVKLYELLIAGHQAVYDAPALKAALADAGFGAITRQSFRVSGSPVMRRETLDQYPDLSLFVEAMP